MIPASKAVVTSCNKKLQGYKMVARQAPLQITSLLKNAEFILVVGLSTGWFGAKRAIAQCVVLQVLLLNRRRKELTVPPNGGNNKPYM
jgi:hypothetical protein